MKIDNSTKLTKAKLTLINAKLKALESENKQLKKLIKFEDYSYYVGGEITLGRVPMKYSRWIDEGCPA